VIYEYFPALKEKQTAMLSKDEKFLGRAHQEM